MTSRVMRTLLKLYPRRIRNRYGDELLAVQRELRAQGDMSLTRLIRDMLAGALLVRPVRQRVQLIIGSIVLTSGVLVIVGLAIAGTIVGGRGIDSPAWVPLPQRQLTVQTVRAMPYATCPVSAGSPCSLTPCTQFVGRPSTKNAVIDRSASMAQPRRRVTGTRCTAYPHVQPQRPVFVGG